MAGDYYANVYPDAHIGVINGIPTLLGLKPRVHKGSANIDETAPSEATGQALATLHLTASAWDLPAFGSAVEAAWGSTFRSAISPVLGDLAKVIASQPSP